MAIKVGDHLPNAKFRVMTAEGPAWKTTDDIFKGKKVALFAVPGAFTGTCHKMHVPSVILHADAIKAKGVNTIAVTAVNTASRPQRSMLENTKPFPSIRDTVLVRQIGPKTGSTRTATCQSQRRLQTWMRLQ